MAVLSFKNSAITWCSSSEAQTARAAKENVKVSVPITLLAQAGTVSRYTGAGIKKALERMALHKAC